MERSWGIVLVLLLISITSYAQLSSGTIANNRFLQRVNPAIDRALADGGSSLNHPEIQRLARQMVDMGVWNNLVFWVHEGLVKERVSGSDVFVPKAYDITANNNDAININTTQQPKILSGELVLDGSDDFLATSNSTINTSYCTVCNWANSNVIATNHTFNRKNLNPGTVLLVLIATFKQWQFNIRLSGTEGTARACRATTIVSTNTWYHVCGTYDGTIQRIYVNGVEENTNSISGTISTTNYDITNIGRNPTGISYWDGEISDVRYFDTNLTATQIDAIFQETKAKYGY